MTLRILFAIALSVAAGTSIAQSNSPRPLESIRAQYEVLLNARSYDMIDRLANGIRSAQLLTSDGQPVLSAIYSAFWDCGCSDEQERWETKRQRLEEWARLKPDSLTARVALASFPVHYAWFFRGGGYANTVSEESWKKFREQVAEGRKRLEALDDEAKQDPGWYESMLVVAQAQGWPPQIHDELFDRAVSRNPYYLTYYFQRVEFYSPKWYGSIAAQRRVIDEAVARTRTRLGESMYARLNWGIQSDQMFANGQTQWPRMKTAFERIVKDYPDPWNTNNFAKFACRANDSDTLARLLKGIGDRVIMEAWGSEDFYRRCKATAGLAS